MVTVTFDAALGGRWTSLSAAGREWLWHRPAPDRAFPSASFVDAGGVEECIPTVRGNPDHGDAWSRPWAVHDGSATVTTKNFWLSRKFTEDGDRLVVSYRLTAAPGWRFLWAAHALLDVSEDAILQARPGTRTRIDGTVDATWPTPLHKLGPDDGTATGAILLDCPTATIADGQRLTFGLEAPGQPVSTALWRNLRGWPAGNPYRSIGVEPMLGHVWDLAEAGPGDAAVVPASGVCEWRLTVTAA
ncbi:hypothetical protein HH310_23205 [Actinoplanes sp. TBRC 11911]|uniref:hypothetical protein n=1 Tax=Actinoplanes sp. TBRC 11911 TaxID=2729386 RepID=UPI00145C7BCF|nr:hypothetical protein [Actinoplanes sp. TBRC 11911]NMO54079.1 hypothetical protein [Actinoplanes sp. TBRC 11911]